MAFVSFEFKRGSRQEIYTLTDTEFGSVVVDIVSSIGIWACVAKEYEKRNLPVGKNLALFAMFCYKQNIYPIKDIPVWQNKCCSEHIKNWDQCAKERDIYLAKLLPLL